MSQVRFAREARSDFIAQIRYYEALQQGLGARFRHAVENTASLAAAYPLHGKPAAAGTRHRLVTSFPFKIVYSQLGSGILIHAVASDHRLPAYWLKRLP